MFDRQAAEVEVLKTLTPSELAAFTEEVLGFSSSSSNGSGSRRKLMVLIRGKNELQQQQGTTAPAADSNGDGAAGVCAADGAKSLAPAAAAADKQQECPAGLAGSSSNSSGLLAYAATAVPAGEPFLLVHDINSFKKGCEVYPAAREQHGRKVQQQKVAYGKGAAAGAEGKGGDAASAANTEEVVAAKL